MRAFLIHEHELEAVESPDVTALLANAAQQPFWLDLGDPKASDIAIMRDIFHFHPLAIEDTVNNRQRPKIEEYGSYLFLILNTVTLDKTELIIRELDAFIGPGYLVTAHQDEEPLLQSAFSTCDAHGSFGKKLSPSYIFYILLDAIVDDYFPALNVLEEEVENIADDILVKASQSYLKRLLDIRRTLAELWRVSGHQRDTFNLMMRDGQPLQIDDNLRYYLRDVQDHVLRVSDRINVLRDTLLSVVDLYFSSQSNRLNLIVQRLAFTTILIGVLTVISGFYGMNFIRTFPAFENPMGVFFVLFLMLVGVVTVVLLARRAES